MSSSISTVAASSLISDARVESQYEVVGEGGQLSTVQIVEFPTVDDLMLHGMKNIAAELKFGTEYTSVQDRGVVTQLTRIRLPMVQTS